MAKAEMKSSSVLNRRGQIIGATGFSIAEPPSTARTVTQSSDLVWDIDQFEKVAGRFLVLRRNMAHNLERRLYELEERSREISRRKPSTVGGTEPRRDHLRVRLRAWVGCAQVPIFGNGRTERSDMGRKADRRLTVRHALSQLKIL